MARGQVARMRYVARHLKRGKVYWYWQRKGFPLTRLPDDEGQRFLRQLELNAVADARLAESGRTPSGAPKYPEPSDSVRSVVAHYEASKRYRKLAPSTRVWYDAELRKILRLYGGVSIAGLSRQVVIDYIEGFETPRQQHAAATVLSCLFNEAMYRGMVASNPAQRLRLEPRVRREVMWKPAELDAFYGATREADPAVCTYFMLARYTAQRPGDCLAMTWHQYDGATIRLRQQKTKKLVETPAHIDLRRYLDALPKGSIPIIGGEPHRTIRGRELEWRRKLGIERVRLSDLRRSAMVAMAEAGATIQGIAAVSGHSIEKTQQIMETYLPRTGKMAAGAIHLWERSDSEKA